MVESSIEKATKIAKGFDLMEEYLNESEKVITDINFGESYDKELALKDLGRQEGEAKSREEIAKNMLKESIDISVISRVTGLDIETIQKIER